MAIFDLPVGTDDERRMASTFRRFLLNDGYLMIQFSVYARPCISQEHVEKHAERLKISAPRSGFVKMLFFTDRQWELGVNIVGAASASKMGNRVATPAMPDQILFW